MKEKLTVNIVLNWLARVKRYLKEWKYFCYGMLLPVASLFVIRFAHCESGTIQNIGAIMQLLAIFTVYYEINSTLKTFNNRGLYHIWIDRIKRFPSIYLEKIEGSANINESRATLTVGLQQNWCIKEADFEKRLDQLEEQVNSLQEDLTKTKKNIGSQIKNIEKQVVNEGEERRSLESNLYLKIEQVSTQGLPIAGMGLFWLFCGILFSSFSHSIQQLLLTTN